MTTLDAQVRERLGLAGDADDEATLAALDQRLTQTPQSGSQQTPQSQQPAEGAETPAPAAEATSTPTSAVEAMVEARVNAAIAPLQTELATRSQQLAAMLERDRVQARDTVIEGAVRAGKITAADREKWVAMYDASPEGAKAVETVFASLAAGSAVPVAPLGTTGAEDTGNGEPFGDAEYAKLFGEGGNS